MKAIGSSAQTMKNPDLALSPEKYLITGGKKLFMIDI